jgi:hypothetical protein
MHDRGQARQLQSKQNKAHGDKELDPPLLGPEMAKKPQQRGAGQRRLSCMEP